jgi:hypothetical protein
MPDELDHEVALERTSLPLPGAWAAQLRRIPPSSRHRDRTVPAPGPPRARRMKRGAEVKCPASPLPPGVRDQRGRNARRRASRGPLGPSEERRSRSNATVVARPRKRRGWATLPKRGRRGVSRPAGPARTNLIPVGDQCQYRVGQGCCEQSAGSRAKGEQESPGIISANMGWGRGAACRWLAAGLKK